MKIAVSGDAIVSRRVSVVENERFLELVEPLRDADVAFTHLEAILLDYDDPGAYPAAEAGGTWMRAPPFVAEELAWMGIDVVSHASNHALDYSYGGLRSTWKHLDAAGVAHAGTGRNLGDARAPAYVETAAGRVGLVSMASSIQPWTRAGDSRSDVRGRPGNNPLRYYHAVDAESWDRVLAVAKLLGLMVTQPREGTMELTPPGLSYSKTTVVRDDDVTGATTIPNERDLEGNLRAIRDASVQADVVIGHLHTHEFHNEGDIRDPATFVQTAARKCIDAGADVFVAQGSHTPLRGIEVYDGKPIFYDPGDFFRMNDTVERLPAEYYYNWEDALDVSPHDATPSLGFTARRADNRPSARSGYSHFVNPPVSYLEGSELGHVVGTCAFEDGEIDRVELLPGTFVEDPNRVEMGVPVRATGEMAERIVADVAEKSEAFDTTVRFEDGVGVVDL